MAARRQKTNDAGKDPAPKKSKRERFLEVAPRRANLALRAMRNLEHCANTASYQYDPSEIGQILSMLDQGVHRVREAFAKSKRQELEVRLGRPILDLGEGALNFVDDADATP